MCGESLCFPEPGERKGYTIKQREGSVLAKTTPGTCLTSLCIASARSFAACFGVSSYKMCRYLGRAVWLKGCWLHFCKDLSFWVTVVLCLLLGLFCTLTNAKKYVDEWHVQFTVVISFDRIQYHINAFCTEHTITCEQWSLQHNQSQPLHRNYADLTIKWNACLHRQIS